MAAVNEKGSHDSSMKNECLIKERMPSHNCFVSIYSYFYSFKCLNTSVIVMIVLMEAIL